jgi:hypothetical protein
MRLLPEPGDDVGQSRLQHAGTFFIGPGRERMDEALMVRA